MQCNKWWYSHFPLKALFHTLKLIMENNIFTFRDRCYLQIKGTIMGALPAPPYATVSFGIFEYSMLWHFINNLLLFVWYLDDILAIRKPHNPLINDREFEAFKDMINQWYDLEWTVINRTSEVVFMDLTISIKNNKIVTLLYEKELNL